MLCCTVPAEDTSQGTCVFALSPLPDEKPSTKTPAASDFLLKDEANAGHADIDPFLKVNATAKIFRPPSASRFSLEDGEIVNRTPSKGHIRLGPGPLLHESPPASGVFLEEDDIANRAPSKNRAELGPCHRLDEFEVPIEKEANGPIGLEVDPRSDNAIVRRIPPGLVSVWNAQAEESNRILEGDRLVQVNEIRGSSDLILAELQKVKAGSRLTLRLQRREEVRVNLAVGRGLIGMDVSCSLKSREGLIVMSISDGAVRNWNDRNKSKAMKIGDRIVEINGVRGEPNELLEALRFARHINMVFVRFS